MLSLEDKSRKLTKVYNQQAVGFINNVLITIQINIYARSDMSNVLRLISYLILQFVNFRCRKWKHLL